MQNDEKRRQTPWTTSLLIEGTDIVLRPYRAADLDALYDLTQQPEIREFLPDWNVPKERRQEWLVKYEIPENQRFLEVVAARGHIGDLRLRLGIVSKETSQFIGWCCTGIKDELSVPNREIVFAISHAYRNRGYATQAVGGLVDYLLTNTDTEVLNAVALVRNVSSNRVIQKSGFEYIGTTDIDDETYNHYRGAR